MLIIDIPNYSLMSHVISQFLLKQPQYVNIYQSNPIKFIYNSMQALHQIKETFSNYSDDLNTPPMNQPALPQRGYLQFDSELNQPQHHNHQELIQETNQADMKKMKEETVFKLKLPEQETKQANQLRNSQNDNKKIKIQPTNNQLRPIVRQSGVAIKIFDLQDQQEQEVIDSIVQSENISKNSSVLLNNQQQLSSKDDMFDINSNSFLDYDDNHLQNIVNPFESKPVSVEAIQQPLNLPILQIQQQEISQALVIQSKLKQIGPIKNPTVIRNFIVEENQDFQYYFPQSKSKDSLDTGLQVTSIMSSRDELSTRNILSTSSIFKQAKSSRKKLPTLTPYQYNGQPQSIATNIVLSQPIKNQKSSKNNIEIQKLMTKLKSGKFAITSDQIDNVYEFIKKPIAYSRIVQCRLVRHKSCLKPCFLNYDLSTNDGKFLLSTKKMAFHFNSTYNLSLMPEQYNEDCEYYLGKAVGNFVGSIFNIYGEAVNNRQRQLQATVHYSPECFCCKIKARQIQIYMKHPDYSYHQLDGYNYKQEKNLKQLYLLGNNQQMRKIRKYINKQPRWNPKIQSYTLNFHGKSKMGSVKNMIIIDEDKPNEDLLLLAKTQDNQFALDISYPFSPMIALGILITSFDFKLASQ